MKIISMLICAIACICLSGCYNNTYVQECRAAGNKCLEPGVTTAASAQPAMMSDPSQIVLSTTYQEVYLTDYTPSGPVVRKAIVPVYVSGKAVPQTTFAPQSVWVQPAAQETVTTENVTRILVSSEKMMPVVPGFPPAQPVNPTMSEPAAFYGPASAPVYSTQTSWF